MVADKIKGTKVFGFIGKTNRVNLRASAANNKATHQNIIYRDEGDKGDRNNNQFYVFDSSHHAPPAARF